jgi:hypothetical protein
MATVPEAFQSEIARALFHSRCDGEGNTLTLIRSTTDAVFGAFTPSHGNRGSKGPIAWRSIRPIPAAPPFFSVSHIRNPQYAINCTDSLGPAFGDNCNVVENYVAPMGYSYELHR